MKKKIIIQDLVFTLLLTTASLFFISYAMQPDIMDFQEDEMTLAYTAQRVSTGELSYNKFFSFVPPLSIYPFAWAFRIFGVSLLTERSLHLFFILSQVLLFYIFLRILLFDPIISFFMALLLPSFVFSYWPIPSHHWVVTLAISLFFIIFIFSLRNKSPILSIVTGLCTGIVPLCVQDMGFLIGLFFVIWLLRDITHSLKWKFIAFISLFIPSSLFILYYLGKGGRFSSMIECLIKWPLNSYKQSGGYNDVNFIRQISSMLSINKINYPIIICFMMFLIILFAAMIYKLVSSKRAQPILIASFWCFFFSVLIYLRGRRDFSHITFLLPLLFFNGVLLYRKSIKKHIIVVFIMLIAFYGAITAKWVGMVIYKPFIPSQFFKVDDGLEVAMPIRSYLKSNPQYLNGKTLVIPYGAFYYFNGIRNPLPIELYLPESKHYNADWENKMMAYALTTGKIRFVIIPVGMHGDHFLKDPTIFLKNLSFYYNKCESEYGHYIYEWNGLALMQTYREELRKELPDK